MRVMSFKCGIKLIILTVSRPLGSGFIILVQLVKWRLREADKNASLDRGECERVPC